MSAKNKKGESITDFTMDASTDAATTQEYINRVKGHVPDGTVELTSEDEFKRDRAKQKKLQLLVWN